jgi:hypothetical protein
VQRASLSIGAPKHLAPIDKTCRTNKKMRTKYVVNYRCSKFRPHRRLGQEASLRRDHSCCSGFSGHSGFPVIADIWLFRLSIDIQLSGCSGFSPTVPATVDKFNKGITSKNLPYCLLIKKSPIKFALLSGNGS